MKRSSKQLFSNFSYFHGELKLTNDISRMYKGGTEIDIWVDVLIAASKI
jgi:hypothetical protein